MLSIYLDEVADDTAKAIKCLNHNGLSSIVLRNINSSKNVVHLCDKDLHNLRSQIAGLKVEAVVSDLVTECEFDLATKAIFVAKFFKSPVVSFVLSGFNSSAWFSRVSDLCIEQNILPVFEPNDIKPEVVAEVLGCSKKWQCLLDPGGCMLKRNCNFYEDFWVRFKDRVACIDVRDVIAGRGFRPVGYGKSNIARIITEASGKRLFLEPGLGRTYKTYKSREQTFALAYESFLGVYDGKS